MRYTVFEFISASSVWIAGVLEARRCHAPPVIAGLEKGKE
jgi:hypothetical protein